MRCTHVHPIMRTRCTRRAGHDGEHIAGFTDPEADPRQQTIYDALEANTE